MPWTGGNAVTNEQREPFFLAGTLLQVRNLRHLPVTTPPVTLAELEDFIIPLANRLLDRSRPPENAEA